MHNRSGSSGKDTGSHHPEHWLCPTEMVALTRRTPGSGKAEYSAKKAEHAKSSVRAKVEHVFGVVKKQLHFRKTRYRGLEKQQAKFNIMFALANLILADRPCLAA